MSSEVACQAVALCEGWRHPVKLPKVAPRDSSTALGMTFMDDRARFKASNVSASITIMKCNFAVYVLIIMATLDANAQSKPSATLIVTNAAVYTVDKQHPKAEAVAVIEIGRASCRERV